MEINFMSFDEVDPSGIKPSVIIIIIIIIIIQLQF